MKKLLLLVMLSVFLIGCGEAKLDMSDEKSIRKSMVKVMAKLDIDERNEFIEAVGTVVSAQAIIAMSNTLKGEETDQSITKVLHKKTAKEIIAMSQQVKQQIAQING